MTPGDAPLKRLGGGRWASRDGRFRIESESGRWVIVDAEQTDELGLPRVRGPYPSLGDARTDLERLASSAPEPSPLAERIAEVRARPAGARATPDGTRDRSRGPRVRRRSPAQAVDAWLADVAPRERDRARRLRDELVRVGVEDPEAAIVADLGGSRPVVAETLLRHRIKAAVEDALRRGDGTDPSVSDALVDRILAILAEDGASGADDGASGLPGWAVIERGGRGRELQPGETRAAGRPSGRRS